MFFASFRWSCLAKINIVLGKWIHLDFIEYQAIFTALFCRNFKFQIELPLVSCEREVKEVAGNESLCKAVGLCFKRAAWREWKPIDGEDGDEPLCFQREEETPSDQLPSLLANTMAGEFGSVLPNSEVNPFSSSHQIKRALATEQSNYPMPALILTLTELLQSHLHIQIKLIQFHSLTICRLWQNVLL